MRSEHGHLSATVGPPGERQAHRPHLQFGGAPRVGERRSLRRIREVGRAPGSVAKSLPELQIEELKRLTVARKDLPADRDEVLRLRADPEGRRNYWE